VEMPSRQGHSAEANNPSVFAATAQAGIGLMPLNDEFRVHSEQSAEQGHQIQLSDHAFVLKAGGEYTAEWAIVPVPKPDFWTFVNAARRALDVNFQLQWMFAFFTPSIPYSGTDEQVKRYIQNKSANLVVESLFGHENAQGHFAFGTAFQQAALGPWQDWVTRMHKLFPDGSVKTAIYYHCFLDTREDSSERFKEDRALDASGKHIDYGGQYGYMKEYVPTLDNAFGRETAKNIDIILDKIGADGVYWDEFFYSAAKYIYNMWDGCSADIDLKSLKITRLKGSTTLLSRDFREYHVKRILARGCPFITNGAPYTRTLARLKFQSFTETGSITNCRMMLLYSPVGLGDYLTEVTEVHAYKNMLKSLDHGCLYAWYHVTVVPTHKTLAEYMYPFTPIELHSGYVIGKERILTDRSGLFGWGDRSKFEVHVFDREGKETREIAVPRVERNGKAYAEIRIPEGYSAAIVRIMGGNAASLLPG
jgi:hypothetical protein